MCLCTDNLGLAVHKCIHLLSLSWVTCIPSMYPFLGLLSVWLSLPTSLPNTCLGQDILDDMADRGPALSVQGVCVCMGTCMYLCVHICIVYCR